MARTRSEVCMTALTDTKFDMTAFLATAGLGAMIVRFGQREAGGFFVQGAEADCCYYLQTGRAKLTVVSDRGKEATITLLGPGDFIGEEAVAGVPGLRMATATALTSCIAMQIDRNEMIRIKARPAWLLGRLPLLLLAIAGMRFRG